MDMQALKTLSDDDAIQVGDQMMTGAQFRDYMKQELDKVHGSITRMRDEWVRHRAQSGVEDRWRKATALYFGDETQDSTFVETLKVGPAKKRDEGTNRSKVVVNIVRPKVDQAVARMCEILLPVDDRNWGIKPTPVPETVSRMIGDQRPTVIPGSNTPTGMTANQEAQAVVKAAKEAAAAMQDAIDDCLTECKYNAEQRNGIEDGVRLGTMILKGPIPRRQTSKVWQPNPDGSGTQQLVIKEEIKPASERRDPWDVWFDPSCGNDHQRGQGVWERRMATRKELRALVGLPGYDADAIREILRLPPTRVRVAEGRVTKLASGPADMAYELWEYHGEIEPDDMAMCSMNTGDPLEDVAFGVILLVNDRVIGAMPSWIPDGSLPYDVWNWRKSDDSPYGRGLPDEMEHQQRVVTAAWRQVMDNARYAVGSQIVHTTAVKPVDGHRQIYPGKTWTIDPDKTEDVNKAFGVFEFPSHLQELMTIATTAMQFADQETSMPQLMGGESGTAPETVGGMVMLYNNANAVLRLRVKLYDDDITNPGISRHYDWQMANNPDPKIKGDFEVDARGSTALLEKDIQNQATLNLANVTSNPRYQAYLDPKEELKVILKAFKIQPQDIMLSDDKIEQNEKNPPPAPQDPRIVAAQTQLQIKQIDLEDRQKQRDADMAKQQEEDRVRAQTMEYNKEREQGEYVIAMTKEQNTRDLTMAKMANDSQTKIQMKEADLGMKHLEIDTKRQLFNAEAALRVRTGQGI